MKKVKATGRRGSWFAEVNGEELPCVHRYWVKGNRYFDPGGRFGHEQFDELFAAILEKRRVIMTNDELLKNGSFKRTGYIAIFDVDEIEMDESGLRFRIADRIDELE